MLPESRSTAGKNNEISVRKKKKWYNKTIVRFSDST